MDRRELSALVSQMCTIDWQTLSEAEQMNLFNCAVKIWIDAEQQIELEIADAIDRKSAGRVDAGRRLSDLEHYSETLKRQMVHAKACLKRLKNKFSAAFWPSKLNTTVPMAGE